MPKTLMLAVCCILIGALNAPAQSASPHMRNPHPMRVAINGVPIQGAQVMTNLAAVQREAGGAAASAGQHRETQAQNGDTLVLTRPVTTDKEFLEWHANVKSGRRDHRTVTLTLTNAEGGSLASYTYRNCTPIRYVGPSRTAQKSNVAMERIKLSCESVARGK